MQKKYKNNQDENERHDHPQRQLEDLKEKAKLANTRAVKAAMYAKKSKVAGKGERAQPGKVKVLNRRSDQQAQQEKKQAIYEAKMLNIATKHLMRRSNEYCSSRFFKNDNRLDVTAPLIHRMRHGRDK